MLKKILVLCLVLSGVGFGKDWSNIDTTCIYLRLDTKGGAREIYDPVEMKESFEYAARNVNSVYKYAKVPRAEKQFWKDAINDTSKILDYVELQSDLKDVNFIKDFHSGTSKIILTESIDYKKILKDKKTTVEKFDIKDMFVYTIGDSTVGSGASYLTPDAAYSDLGNLTGPINLTIISDVTVTTQATMTEALNGHAFSVTSSVPHYGDPTRGWKISVNFDGFVFYQSQEGNGTVEICNLNFVSIRNHATGTNYIGALDITSGTQAISIHDNLMDGNGEANVTGIFIDDTTPIAHLYNNKIWQANTGIYCKTMNAANIIENNTVYNNVSFGLRCNSQTFTVRNNAGIDNGVTDFRLPGSATGYNNADSDSTANNSAWATGSDNVLRVTVASEFLSVTDTDSTFLQIDTTGTIWKLGTTPSITDNILTIEGYVKPTVVNSYQTIGASGALEVAPVTTGITSGFTGSISGGWTGGWTGGN